MSSQVVYVSKGTHPMIPLRLYSAHGHKRKETPIFFVAFISPPFPLLPSFLHPFWPLSTSSPLSFLHLPPHPPPRQAHSPLPSPLSLSLSPASPRVLHVPPSFSSLPFSCLLCLSFPWVLNSLSSLLSFPPHSILPEDVTTPSPWLKYQMTSTTSPTSIKSFTFLKILKFS